MSEQIGNANDVIEVELDTTELLALALPAYEREEEGADPYDISALLGATTEKPSARLHLR